MFSKMNQIITTTEKEKRTGIDEKMLAIAQQFVREDFIVLSYSRKERRNADGVMEAVPDPIPDTIVKDFIHSEGYGKLKSKITELTNQLKYQNYLIQDLE